MGKKKKEQRHDGITRRDFMKKGAVAMGAAVTTGMALPNLVKPARAAKFARKK